MIHNLVVIRRFALSENQEIFLKTAQSAVFKNISWFSESAKRRITTKL